MLGVALGVPTALFTMRLLTDLLYTTSPRDPVVYVAVILGIALVSLVAAFVPARRAVAVDPIIALKSTDG